jgi:hypothetical protein
MVAFRPHIIRLYRRSYCIRNGYFIIKFKKKVASDYYFGLLLFFKKEK